MSMSSNISTDKLLRTGIQLASGNVDSVADVGNLAFCEGRLNECAKDTTDLKAKIESLRTQINSMEKQMETQIKSIKEILSKKFSPYTRCDGCKNLFKNDNKSAYLLECAHVICSECFNKDPDKPILSLFGDDNRDDTRNKSVNDILRQSTGLSTNKSYGLNIILGNCSACQNVKRFGILSPYVNKLTSDILNTIDVEKSFLEKFGIDGGGSFFDFDFYPSSTAAEEKDSRVLRNVERKNYTQVEPAIVRKYPNLGQSMGNKFGTRRSINKSVRKSKKSVRKSAKKRSTKSRTKKSARRHK